MPRLRTTPAFTTKRLEALKPRAAAYEAFDTAAPGLQVRVLPTGRKVFRWRYRLGEGDRTVTLAPFAATVTPGCLTLAEAHLWLDRLRQARDAGEDQLTAALAELRRLLAPAPAASGEGKRLFGTVVEEFYRDDVLRNRKRPEHVRSMLDREIKPFLAGRPLDEITTLEARDVVKRIVARGAVNTAGKVLAILKQAFNWAQSNGFTDKNPAAPLRARHLGITENISTRALDETEIPLFWRALDAERGPSKVERPDPRTGKTQVYEQRTPTLAPATAIAFKLLLLTGVRTGELVRATWDELDLEGHTWTVPVAHQKLTKVQERRARPFVIPLAPTALALFRELKAAAGASPWVMPSPDPESKTGRYDDKALGHAMRRLVADGRLALPGGPICPHDLRRTFRSTLGRLEVSHWIAERCLNHSLGKIAETYDRGDYLRERTEALVKMDAYVQRLLDPAASRVAFLPARAPVA